jgi:Xaa-Pro aminopeptidase
MRNIYRRTIKQCCVGVKASTIQAFAEQQFRQHGYPDQISLVGHSVGAWWHQQEPYIVPTCHQELEAGMVLALEPHVGFWHLQDLVEITSDGPNLLSDRFNTDEMFVV